MAGGAVSEMKEKCFSNQANCRKHGGILFLGPSIEQEYSYYD
jgi:hypothetical protein